MSIVFDDVFIDVAYFIVVVGLFKNHLSTHRPRSKEVRTGATDISVGRLCKIGIPGFRFLSSEHAFVDHAVFDIGGTLLLEIEVGVFIDQVEELVVRAVFLWSGLKDVADGVGPAGFD